MKDFIQFEFCPEDRSISRLQVGLTQYFYIGQRLVVTGGQLTHIGALRLSEASKFREYIRATKLTQDQYTYSQAAGGTKIHVYIPYRGEI